MGDEEQKPPSYEDLCANFSIDVPEYYNFGFDVIDAWAKKDRNKLAMIWVDQKGNEKKYTFFDLMRLSNQAVNICLKYGIKKGDRVMLMLPPRTPEWWIFVIALIKLGAVYCPPATTMLTPPKDLKYRIQAADIRMIITMAEHADKVEEIREECPPTLAVRLMIDGVRDGWVSYPVELDYPAPCSHKLVNLPPGMHRTKATDPLLIFFTSGTTGEPKMVVHNHSYPLGHLVTAQLWHDLHPNDLHLTLSDTGWGEERVGGNSSVSGSSAPASLSMISGGAGSTPPRSSRCWRSTGSRRSAAPPTIYRMLILADLDKFDLADMRHCCSAGEALNPPEVIRAWEEGTGRTIYEGYGQTETVLCIGTLPGMKPKPGSMGRPMPGWHIELHDDDGNPVGVGGEEGRIAINVEPRPVGLFSGYLNNSEENRKVFSGGFYYTGDKAYMDEDGYFWFIGRDDDVIKSSGYRIGPFEVESASWSTRPSRRRRSSGRPTCSAGWSSRPSSS
ncbi:AMP-binding protein [Methanoculleus chikugoensis]|uniref:AMP-binding protein n=1 Tax=Methanoculleus chikugoensis TaxID=118126 RepID=UPI000B18CDAC|nr:AMP-binding protein [Methanoculleus chikugoensis]